MTGFVVPVASRARGSVRDEFATALARRNEQFRQRMVQFMLLCALVLVPLPDEVVERVEEYARELGVDERHAARRGALRARQPRARAHRLPAQRLHGDVGPDAHAERCTRRARSTDAWEQCVVRSRSSRSGGRRCATLPDGTLGREVVEVLRRARASRSPAGPAARRRCSRSTTGCTCSPTTGRRSSARSRCSRSSRAPTTTRARSRCSRW